MKIVNKIKRLFRSFANDIKIISGRYIAVAISGGKGYDGKLIHQNWGDDINYYFVKELSEKDIVLLNDTIFSKRWAKNYLIIGSTIGMEGNTSTIVWGAGLISENACQNLQIKKFCAVRGPKTRDTLTEHGFECPDVYGDPALLLPLYYRPDMKKKYRIGIIPHYVDTCIFEHSKNDNRGVLVISPGGYSDWHEFIDQIVSCESIVSSSLHGLIIAEAYGIKSKWMEIVGSEMRDRFKYDDFYFSIGKNDENPIYVDENFRVEELVAATQKWYPGNIDLSKLLNNCPFAIKPAVFEK